MEGYTGIQKTLSTFNNGGVRGYHFPLAKISEQKKLTSEEIVYKCSKTFHELTEGVSIGNRFFTNYFPLSSLLTQWREECFHIGGLQSTLDFCLELEKPDLFCIPKVDRQGTMFPIFCLSNGVEINLYTVYEFWRKDCEDCKFAVKVFAPWMEEQTYMLEPDKEIYGKYVVEEKSVFPTTWFAKILFS